jgi:hypothetical protein
MREDATRELSNVFHRAFYAAVCAYLMPVSVLVAGLNYANAKR